jgi:hypothetical protein
MVQAGFQDIVTDTVVMPSASLNNWLANSTTPKPNAKIVRAMHGEAPWCVKQANKTTVWNSEMTIA